MRFDELDTRMRRYETAHDHCVLPGIYMVARIDGRNFTRLTKDVHDFEAPFDERFRDCMIATLARLMDCGLRAVYGYTQSDELSVLLHRDEDSFQRKLRKLDSVLAGEASAAFTLALGAHGAFDARISQLPAEDLVVDYFRWRQADASRNALNAHAYWALRKRGDTPRAAHGDLEQLTTQQKHDLLHEHGVNFNDLPRWQKRGIGMWWDEYEKPGHNPVTGQDTVAIRRRLHTELDLEYGDAYSEFLRCRVQEATGLSGAD